TPGRCRCSTASAPPSSAGWPRPAARGGPTSPTASTGTGTSCGGWPSARPTCGSSCARSPHVPERVPAMDGITQVPPPRNEPVLNYAPGSPERTQLETRLAELADAPFELTMTLGGRERMAGGAEFDVVQPHRHASVLGRSAHSTAADAEEAVRSAKEAAPGWQALSF